MTTEIRNGEYSMSSDGFATRVYKKGELLGHFWEDSRSNGYAVFATGNSKPIGRPKSPRGCVLKLTNREWDGKPAEAEGGDPDGSSG